MENTDKLDEGFDEVFLNQIRKHLIEENWQRLKECVSLCDESQLWYRTNNNTNSIGNLVLHLYGNINQWIVHGIGGKEDIRVRNQEFIINKSISKQCLLANFQQLINEVDFILRTVNKNNLLDYKKVQGFDTTVMGILIHVTEHFSYHVGQISLMTKQYFDLDLKYYDGVNLD